MSALYLDVKKDLLENIQKEPLFLQNMNFLIYTM